jgi:glycosyltransferase involved in cell wall biosynthesis
MTPRRRILVVSNDHVGSRMAGPGIRYLNFARELRHEGDVTLVVPFATDLEPNGFELVVANVWDPHAMDTLASGADCVVTQRLPVPTMRRLARTETRRIYDLYAPLHIENLALDVRQGEDRQPAAALELNRLTQEVALRTGDAFVCASETQRDLWLGALLQAGRIDLERFAGDPALRGLIDVVPFGIDPEPPHSAGRVLRGVLPGIGDDDRVLLWPGGIWNWFDPLTVIDAVAELARRRDDVRLVFLGLRHPNRFVPAMEMAREAVARAEGLGLRDRVVFFNEGWVPYEERGAYLLEADLGVSAHFDDLESRFAFRTRLLDCFWAGLPVVTTKGDVLGDLVDRRGLGRAVAPRDGRGWVDALDSLLSDEAAYERARAATASVRDDYLWPRAVEPLRRLVQGPGAPVEYRRTVVTAASWINWRVRHAVAQRGVVGAARRVARLAERRLSKRQLPLAGSDDD